MIKVKGQSPKLKKLKIPLCFLKTRANWEEISLFPFPNAIIEHSRWIEIFFLHCVTFLVLENIILANHKCFEFITEKEKNGKKKKIHTYNPQSSTTHCFSSTFTHFY